MLFVVLPYAVHGCLFYAFSQVSHIQDECFAGLPDGADAAEYHHDHPLDANESMAKRSIEAVRLRQQAVRAQLAAGEGAETVRLRRVGASAEDKGEASQPPAPAPPREEWAVHQMGHALDYAVTSRFWLHVSNGLNLQVVHHLFPQVGWGHHLELSKIVAEVAKEHGVAYNTKPSFAAAMGAHLGHLRRVNDSEQQGSLWVRPPMGRASRETLEMLGQLDSH